MEKIGIQGLGTISPLSGVRKDAYEAEHTCIKSEIYKGKAIPAARLSSTEEDQVREKRASKRKYAKLDRSVILSMIASERAIAQANWQHEDIGINIGSSRGATELFEKYHKSCLDSGEVNPLSSPTTSLGNLASWVAQDLGSADLAFSHSITCSTAMHAMLNGIAWLNSGMHKKFLVGGAEAPLTDFTIAQMRALTIYASNGVEYPCRALDLNKSKNTFVLGEGAGSICLQKGLDANSLAWVRSWGFSQEKIQHHTSLSENADCFINSMKMALAEVDQNEIDAVIMHAPGTVKGDQAEYNAIKEVFGTNLPSTTSNKWKIGHTLGASGILSIDMAVAMIEADAIFGVPYLEPVQNKKINNVMVNAAGFGGNAVSIIISRNPLKK